MEHDVDLLRELMVSLEARQRSPRTIVVISLAEEAGDLGRSPAEIEAGLDALLALDYIDGAGHDEDPDYWLFRTLTRKGRRFVEATRTEREWAKMKRHFGMPAA